MSDRALYLRAAEDLRGNAGQWDAYNSSGHCVVLAGPGSGKTKTLTIKLARMLSEDVHEPRGIACITYNNECARELEQRLDALGVEAGPRVFIGTVHSFSLTQIVLPYARTANTALPDDFRIATRTEQDEALGRALARVFGGVQNPQGWSLNMNRYRRSILDRSTPEWRGRDADMARLVEAYEAELRARRMIDFEDMPLLALRALRENDWLPQAILAKYPTLAVDEYQDLGRPLHEMVMELCFGAGIRLFAVGDVDQSIYAFTGAHPELLRTLAERDDVTALRLRLNYRCGSRIVVASQYALGEDRGYKAPEGAAEGTIYFHPQRASYERQAAYLFANILPAVGGRMPDLRLHEIAILYPAAWIGDAVDQAAKDHGFATIRTDGNALYPRANRLLRWLELCAVWCCQGWRSGLPRFSRIVSEGMRLFAESLDRNEDRLAFQKTLLSLLWQRREPSIPLRTWLSDIREDLLGQLFPAARTLSDERDALDAFIAKTEAGGEAADMTLGVFSGHGEGNDMINLSTLHSAKGREFSVVILFCMDAGRIPRNNASAGEQREARRLFYVGFTRAKRELHIMHSAGNESPFVEEVRRRIDEEA